MIVIDAEAGGKGTPFEGGGEGGEGRRRRDEEEGG
jgi:hypothetical protein